MTALPQLRGWFVGFWAAWAGLGGCEQRPAAPDAAARPAAGVAAQDSAARARAAWAKTLTTTQTVAPGLRVLVRPLPAAGAADWPEPGTLQLTFAIERNGRVVYRDTTADELTYAAVSEPQALKHYPRWVPGAAGTGSLLVAFSNRPALDLVRCFRLVGARVTRPDTLPLFFGPARNLDADAAPEFAGVRGYGETWDGERPGQRWTSYVPVLYYESRPTGLALDSALTQRRNRQIYGVFRGYRYSEAPGIPAATAGPRLAREMRRLAQP